MLRALLSLDVLAMSDPYRPDAILRSIVSLLHGFSGTVCRVPVGTFLFGAFEGLDDDNIKALALNLEGKHRFDVMLDGDEPNEATPVSAIGPSRTMTQHIAINVYTALESSAEHQKRFEKLADIALSLATARQALAHRGNLSADENGTPTAIVSGLLGNIRTSIVRQDWDAGIHQAQITADAILDIAQSV